MKYLLVCLLSLCVCFLAAQPMVRFSEKGKQYYTTRIAFSYQGNAYLLQEQGVSMTQKNYKTGLRIINERFEIVSDNVFAEDEEAASGRFLDFFEVEQGGWFFSVAAGNLSTPAKLMAQRLSQSGLEFGAVNVILQKEVLSQHYQPTFYLDLSEDRSRIMVVSITRGFIEGSNTKRDIDEVHIQVYDASMELLWEGKPAQSEPKLEFIDFKVNNDGSVFWESFSNQSSSMYRKQAKALYLYSLDDQGEMKRHTILERSHQFTSYQLTILPAGDILMAGITYPSDYPSLHLHRFDPFSAQITNEQVTPIKVSPLLYPGIDLGATKDYHRNLFVKEVIVVDDKTQYVLAEFLWSKGEWTNNDLLVIPVTEGKPGQMNVLPKSSAYQSVLKESKLHIIFNGDLRNLAKDAKYRKKQRGTFRDLIWCVTKPDGSMQFNRLPFSRKGMIYASRAHVRQDGKLWLPDGILLNYRIGLLELPD
jgi:hypothetical protein